MITENLGGNSGSKNGLQQCIKNISGSVVYETFVRLISSAKSAI